MCGIAGYIGPLDPSVHLATRAMSDAMYHRGPDGAGYWNSGDGQNGVSLAHRRLAIIDLREIANQPMHDLSNGNVIVFNGEIYNYRELRNTLLEEGLEFSTEGDTEVLLKAYGLWGEDCLSRLRGMFAFAVWDAQTRTVFMARDRLGIKPLYYHLDAENRSVLFASELRSILASNRVPRKLDTAAVQSYLWHGFVPGPGTLVQNVRLLNPGSCMRVSAEGKLIAQRRYWVMPRNSGGGSHRGDAELFESTQQTLEDAIRLRMRSDVPVAVFLSGGVDSSVTTLGAAKASEGNVESYTIGFSEAEYDESLYSKQYAEHIGIVNHVERIEQSRFMDMLPQAIAAMDQPTFDGINSYLISRTVADQGVKVALSGTGGDELFGGYSSFAKLEEASRRGRIFRHIPRSLLSSAAQAIDRLQNRPDRDLKRFLGVNARLDRMMYGHNLVSAYQHWYSVFNAGFIDKLHVHDERLPIVDGIDAERHAWLADQIEGYPADAAIGFLETHSFLSERVLRDADAMSMAVSLELRVPLIDHLFVESLAQWPHQRRYQPFGQKQLLRELGLPKDQHPMFERPKTGFTLPIAEWINDALGEQVKMTLLDEALARQCQLNPSVLKELVAHNRPENKHMIRQRIWSLYIFMNWCRIHHIEAD